jgi:16S rRNA processing protein RimM
MGAKGLAGALRVDPMTDLPERLAVGSSLFIEGETRPRAVVAAEHAGRIPVLRLEGIETRDAAAALQGRYLEVEAETLPEGTYYWHQIEGLRVLDVAGAELGSVVEVFRAGENEVYRVEGHGGELLLPALASVVRAIDLAAGTMIVDYQSEEVR